MGNKLGIISIRYRRWISKGYNIAARLCDTIFLACSVKVNGKSKETRTYTYNFDYSVYSLAVAVRSDFHSIIRRFNNIFVQHNDTIPRPATRINYADLVIQRLNLWLNVVIDSSNVSLRLLQGKELFLINSVRTIV